MTLQALVYDPGAANDKRQFIEIWLDHYMSELNVFSFFRLAQMPPKASIRSSARSSLRPSLSTPSLQPSLSTSSSTPSLSGGLGAGAKRVGSATKINARALKRTKRAVLNSSSRAEIDAEADEPSLDDPLSAAGNDASEPIEAGEEDDTDELQEELGKCHNTSFRSLLVTSFSSQGSENLALRNLFIF
jgi:hypothetical protein